MRRRDPWRGPRSTLGGAPLAAPLQRGIALLLLAATACASDVPPGPRLVRLELRGHAQLDREELAPLVRFAQRSPLPWAAAPAFDEADLDAAVQAIEEAYRRRGYFSATVTPELTWDDARQRVEVELRIVEGSPVRITERTLALAAGAPPLATEPLLEGLPAAPGETFEIAAYERAKQALLDRVRETGHLGARLRGGATIDVERQSARIGWTLDPGPLVLLGELEISGLQNVAHEQLAREVDPPRGRPLPGSWLTDTQQSLSSLGWFRSVSVRASPAPTPEVASSPRAPGDEPSARAARAEVETWPVSIDVEERPPRSVLASIGYGTEDRVRVRLGWEHRHLLGAGRSLRLQARRSSLETAVEARVAWPRIAGSNAGAELRLVGERQTLAAYEARRLQTFFELVPRWLRPGLPSGRPGSVELRLGHRAELSRTHDVSPSAEAVLDDPEQRNVLSAAFVRLDYAALDDPVEPTRGGALRLSSELSTRGIGSDHDYLRTELDLRAFRPWRGAVIAGRLRLGTALPFGGTEQDEVPITERFFAGGGDSVRGFDHQELGPVDASGEPVGGTSSIVGSVELRVPLFEQLGGVLFVDAGQVDLEPLHFRLGSLLVSSGAGLRFSTPVGPLRLDVASLLNPPRDLDRVRVHLSIGHAF